MRHAAAGVLAGALAVLGLTVSSVPAANSAAVHTFTATLTGAAETPPNASAATGSATVTLNDTEDLAVVSLTFSGLSSKSTAGHIHGPAAPGKNAPVVINFLGFPTEGTSGAYKRAFTLTPDLVDELKAGKLYVNIHSVKVPSGEIRGQLVPQGSQLSVADGRKCRGFAATVVGSEQADDLKGTPGRDVIVGLGGDDRIRGLGGADVICGGAGNDLIRGGDGRDLLYGGVGDDTLMGEFGDDRLLGGSGDDILVGGQGADYGRGGVGDDTLSEIEDGAS
jgi:Ca2+-binding RTX toxin-like protein